MHTPGDMKGNHAVIEVKPVFSACQNCSKDLNTLAIFKENVGYARAIYLVYGFEIDQAVIDRIADTYQGMELRVPIELWLHTAPGHKAFCERELEPSGETSIGEQRFRARPTSRRRP